MIPIASFAVWVCLLFSTFHILKFDLELTNQIISPFFFISYLILIFVWAFSGPIAAAVLTFLSVSMVFYLCLATKEPSYFLQIFFYGFLFILIVSFLYEVQKKLNKRRLVYEKLMEDTRLAREEALKKEELKKALEDKIERFIDLHRFSDVLKDIPDVNDVADRMLSEVQSTFRSADECVLYLLNESNQQLWLAASRRRAGGSVLEKHGSIFDQWVVRRSRPVMVEDSKSDFRFGIEKGAEEEAMRSVAASPLMTENKVLGVLRVSSGSPRQFSPDDLRLLDIISDLGAGILRNRLLYKKMEELAVHDSLTGLFLYRYFQERLAEEIKRSQMSRKPFSLILLDIDHFKRYNDEYGHSAGDMVLKSIAGILQNNVSLVDLVARYGGEEFIVLLPNKDHAEAVSAAERLRTAIEKNKLTLRRIESSITASFGVVTFPDGGFTAEELVRAADLNLYEAKRSGRNRVCGNI